MYNAILEAVAKLLTVMPLLSLQMKMLADKTIPKLRTAQFDIIRKIQQYQITNGLANAISTVSHQAGCVFFFLCIDKYVLFCAYEYAHFPIDLRSVLEYRTPILIKRSSLLSTVYSFIIVLKSVF